MAKNLVANLSKKDLKQLAFSAFPISISARFIQLIMGILLARSLGPEGYGSFVFALGAATIFAQVGSLGWPMAMSRFIPEYTTKMEWAHMKGLLFSSNIIVGLGVICVILVTYGGAHLVGAKPDIMSGLILGSVMALPISFRLLLRNKLAAIKRAPTALLIDELISPLGLVIFILAGFVQNAFSAGLLFSLTGGIGVLYGILYFAKNLPPQISNEKKSFKIKFWTSVSIPMILGISAKIFMARADTVMLGPLSTFDQVGYYGAAFRITYLLTFPQVVIMTFLAPMFSKTYAEKDTDKLRKLFVFSIVFGLATVVPAVALINYYNLSIVNLIFGVEFGPSSQSLVILAFGQAAAAITIPMSALMMMSEREKAFGLINLFILFINVALNLVLIPEYGAVGAAYSGLISQIILLLASGYFCQSILRNVPNEHEM